MTQAKEHTYSKLASNTLKFDKKTGIYFGSKYAQECFDRLMNFHCPNSSCDFVACDGWSEMKKHVANVHKKFFWYAPRLKVFHNIKYSFFPSPSLYLNSNWRDRFCQCLSPSLNAQHFTSYFYLHDTVMFASVPRRNFVWSSKSTLRKP